jgi:Domain of unknown function (DUF4432)
MRLYEAAHTRRDLAARTGMLSQLAGVQLYTLSDGVERGVRCLEFRTGSGLVFTVLVDRAMDIARCEYRGAAIGWHSPTGFRHPGLHEYEGEGGLSWLRSFSGLLVTGGLDHTLFMETHESPDYHYAPRAQVGQSLHGRVSQIPARLTGYGETWRDDECVLWAEGIVQQSTVFGEDLHLHRRIEVAVGSNTITLHDKVINHGFYRTPHMFLYHINAAYPVLDEGSEYIAPIVETPWASHGDDLRAQHVGYRTQPAPQRQFHEQVYEHTMAADADGIVPVMLCNRRFDQGRGLGFMVETRKDEFPCAFEWQNLQEGHYAIGLEPSTHHVLGKPFARERDELIWLEHGESRAYHTRLSVLPDNDAIDEQRARIEQIARQPSDEYVSPTGQWEMLGKQP